jgi:hypothetical protein
MEETMDTNKALAKTLGIEIEEVDKPKRIKREAKKVPPTVLDDTTQDQAEDYSLGRSTLRNLIDTGVSSLEDMKDLARQSESPRAYEVMSTMMKTIAEMTKDLYDLQKKTKDLKDISDPRREKDPDGTIHVEKAVFCGTTSDLLKMIKDKENNK